MIDEKDIPRQLESAVQYIAEDSIRRLRSHAKFHSQLSVGRVRIVIEAEGVSVLGDVTTYQYEASAGRIRTDPGPEAILKNWPERQ